MSGRRLKAWRPYRSSELLDNGRANVRLDCIRHGLTIENARGVYHSQADGVLTDDQIGALSRVRFDVTGYDAIFCSPLGRCRETARVLGIRAYAIDWRISERHFGVFEGLTAAECAARYPNEFRTFLSFDAAYRPPDGESRSEHFARTLDWLRDSSGHQRVLAITHGGTIDFLYRMAHGIDLHGGDKIFSASPASISSFEVRLPDVSAIGYDQRLLA